MAVNFIDELSASPRWELAVGGEFRAVTEYVDGERTKNLRQVSGKTLYRTSCTLFLSETNQTPAVLEVACEREPEALHRAIAKVPAGAEVSVRGPGRGQYGLTLTIRVPEAGLAQLRGSSGQPVVKAA